MKKWLICPVFLLMMTGCGIADPIGEQAQTFRQQVSEARQISFAAELCADYIDRIECFSLECVVDAAGNMSFTVTAPEEISGITGSVSGESGTLTFDETVLAFPLLAQERLSPVSGPWVLIDALRSGALAAWTQEGENLRLTVDDSYGDDPLTLEVWIRDGAVIGAEIGWRGIRQMTMEVGSFRME